ncbi:hypothetical protein [Glaciibacter sp. 2TAF33]|uniref:hypothetical protein n=1 Tax=Glaciibacter sp. 2TAF33 TaxID=3233015 RepID=UPI003F9077B7
MASGREPHEGRDVADAGGPSGSFGSAGNREFEKIHRELELHILDGSLDGVVTYRDALFSRFFTDRPAFTLAWPAALYIPSEADASKYWFTEPPADHRYRYSWTDPQPTASAASEKTGHLFSWVNVSDLGADYTGAAGTGVQVIPQATLSTVKVSADIDLVANHHWWYLPGTSAGYSNFSYSGTVYIAGWEINPVTGVWELLRPFGSRSLFSFRESGAGGSAIVSTRHAFNDLSVRMQLQGGHTYGIGVAFEVQVSFVCTDGQGHPYVKQPGDDIKLWASILGDVASISVATETVWIP